MDLQQLNKVTSYKELANVKNLEINRKYKVLKLRVSKTKYGQTILVETEDFVCYLPRRFFYHLGQEGVEKFNENLKNRTVYLVSKGLIDKTTEIIFTEE